MAKTPQDFINAYNGKAIDYDGVANVQCVDAFKQGCAYLDIPVKATPTGWADGYWWNRLGLGYSKYFDFITNAKALRKGDWCIWAYGSRSCPSSHIGMFVEYANTGKTIGRIFSENQGTAHSGFSTVNINLDICGALRPKAWADTSLVKNFVTKLYKNILGRKPDTGGMNTWVNALMNGQAAKNVVASFFNSKEYTNKKTSNEQFVIDCYKGYLDRKPDASGTKHWESVLKSKGRQAVLNGFGNSAEFKRITAKYGLN